MSHITKIDLVIKDLDALGKACGKLGLELVKDQKVFRGYSQGKCDHAIRVKGAPEVYEIGLVKGAAGYDLKWDGHMGSNYGPAKPLYDAVGYGEPTKFNVPASINKLKDWYAAEVARKQMSKQGFMVRTIQKGRKVQVLCSK